MALKEALAEIIRLDKLIAEITTKPVVSIADIAQYKSLKGLRRGQVRIIQNART